MVVSCGSLDVPLQVGSPLRFVNFSAANIQFSFKEIQFGHLKGPPEWPLIC